MARSRWVRGSAVALVVFLATSLPVPSAANVPTRTPIWSSTFQHRGTSESAIAVSPTSNTVYVGGRVKPDPERFVIAAYATGTGERRWLGTYPGGSAPSSDCWLTTLAITPDGSTLFAAGGVVETDGSGVWVTTAIDAATGVTRSVSRVSNSSDWTPSLVMTPAGDRVFVVGMVRTNGRASRVIAYDTTIGDELWRVRLVGGEAERALGVSPDGNRLYVGLVRREAGAPLNHLAVVSLATASGSLVWERSFGKGNRMWEAPYGLAVDPLGERVYVLVERESSYEGRWPSPLILAFGATGGRLRWSAKIEGIFVSSAVDIAASPERVLVTDGYGVVSHAARTGRRQWGTGTDPLGQNWWAYAAGLALSPDGDRLFVNESFENTGGTGARLVTIGLDARTGAVRWSAMRRITRGGGEVTVGPAGGRVFVAGSLFGGTGPFGQSGPERDRGFVTMAYAS